MLVPVLLLLILQCLPRAKVSVAARDVRNLTPSPFFVFFFGSLIILHTSFPNLWIDSLSPTIRRSVLLNFLFVILSFLEIGVKE